MPMSNLGDDIKAGLKNVGKDWKRAKKNASDKNDQVHHVRLSYMRRYHPPKITLRSAAFEVMEEAYNKASSNGKYCANARQIMYAARPKIIEIVGEDAWTANSDVYFTQTLLKDYIEERGGMNVVWDARGHLKEPHTNYEIGLGGADVMKYEEDQTGNMVNETESIEFQERIKTTGPVNRYGAVLFIEKEGFDEQLEDAGIPEKWDIAIMSSKGIPNAATCDVGAMIDVPVLALHDFDYAGFKIVKTLREGTRLSSGISNLIDIGLRLEDVEGLESEPVDYKQMEDPKRYLSSCGATSKECNFLVTGNYGRHWGGQRVEINVLSTEEIIDLLERKFTQNGIRKVVPDADTLTKAYKRAAFCQELKEKAKEIVVDRDDLKIPDDLLQQVEAALVEDPSQSWDEVVWDLSADNAGLPRRERKPKEDKTPPKKEEATITPDNPGIISKEDEYDIPEAWTITVSEGENVLLGNLIAFSDGIAKITAKHWGRVHIDGRKVIVSYEVKHERRNKYPRNEFDDLTFDALLKEALKHKKGNALRDIFGDSK